MFVIVAEEGRCADTRARRSPTVRVPRAFTPRCPAIESVGRARQLSCDSVFGSAREQLARGEMTAAWASVLALDDRPSARRVRSFAPRG